MPYNEYVPAPILATKLFLPLPRPGIVPRPRLVERLDTTLAPGKKLALISASAGFGKTTLVSEWIATLSPAPGEAEGAGLRVAWLWLDEADQDLTRFLTYLFAALQGIASLPDEGAFAAGQIAGQASETLLTRLLNGLVSCPDRLLLVLDDYHLVASGSIDQAVTFLLDHLPAQMRLIILTREDPSLPLPRYRVRGQLTELRAADLRFSPEEAGAFLNQAMNLRLSEDNIAALEARTEGWIAGLQLAALSMQGQKDLNSFIQSFTGSQRFILDYLLEEVLNQQPEPIQRFLLRTSILNRLCADLCQAVWGEDGPPAQETLEALERANLFLIPLDQDRRWYRYHHLFGDMLRQRLGKPPQLAEYHLRASVWYAEHDELAEAYQHALSAGEYERAARLVEAAWQEMEDSFQTAAWIGWVKHLPAALVCARPRLCYQLGVAFSDAGEAEGSERHLKNAELALAAAADPGEARFLAGSIALVRAYNGQMQGKWPDAAKFAGIALQLIPEDDIFRRAQAAITLEFIHWASGDLEAALQAIRAWMESMRRVGNLEFAIASAFAEADLLVGLGRLREAIRAYQHALQLADAQGRDALPITAHHHLGLALIYLEQGQEEAAAPHLQKSAELGKRTTLVDWPYRWHLAQARLKEAQGEWEAALDLLDRAAQVYVKNPVPILRPIEALKARVHLQQGRLEDVKAWVSARGLCENDEVSYLGEFEYLTLARVRLAERVFTGVDHLLKRLLALAESQKRLGSVLEILLTMALVSQAEGRQPLAFKSLESALTLAEPEGYLNTFLTEGEPLRVLLAEHFAVRRKQPPPGSPRLIAYEAKLLDAFSPTSQPVPSPTPARPAIDLVEALSGRELEILRMVALGLSNSEISQRLFLALSTVKGHNLHIFAKLGVQNRTEAVARARALGLL